MLITWMAANQINKWNDGVNFVQFVKYRAYHSGIKISTYKPTFSYTGNAGLSFVTENILHSIIMEKIFKKLEYSRENVIKGS